MLSNWNLVYFSPTIQANIIKAFFLYLNSRFRYQQVDMLIS
jgi:hypothetical protein